MKVARTVLRGGANSNASPVLGIHWVQHYAPEFKKRILVCQTFGLAFKG